MRTRSSGRFMPLAATAVTGLLALLLWGSAFWQLGTSAGAAMTAPTTTGHVIGCAEAPMGPGCTVRYTDARAQTVTRAVDRPGLIGVQAGDTVPVWLLPADEIQVAGWRPWADGAILLGLALAMTSGAVHWFARALRAGEEYTVFDLRVDEAPGQIHRRRAG